MSSLADMLWVERRKALRSGLPQWTALGSLFMPLAIGFLIYVSRNPEISQKLGLVSAKADLIAFSATDWPAYFKFFGQLIAAGGFFLFALVIGWVFGREFVDGTLKDILAVPVRRSSILLAKFILSAVWCAALSLLMVAAGLLIGALTGLPGGSPAVYLRGLAQVLLTAALLIVSLTPYAFFASLGRGYLLPLGMAVLTLMAANLVVILGWGEFFPWAVPGLIAQAEQPLPALSYWIVGLTGLAGMLVTHLWWKYADQNR